MVEQRVSYSRATSSHPGLRPSLKASKDSSPCLTSPAMPLAHIHLFATPLGGTPHARRLPYTLQLLLSHLLCPHANRWESIAASCVV